MSHRASCRRRRCRGLFDVGRRVGADGALLPGAVDAGVGRRLLGLLRPLLNLSYIVKLTPPLKAI